ncbi:MAG: polyprenyl diphosphate synthase [Egibacteraceae bacterium]
MVANLLYRLYERRLSAGLPREALPNHVAVILDGNRRYARQMGFDTAAGHRRGAEKIHELLDWCRDLEIPYVTLWLLSTANMKRDPDELRDLVEIIVETLDVLADQPEHDQQGMRITGMGALDTLPDPLHQAIKRAEERTAHRNGIRVQIAVGYGGRQEIADALRGLLEEHHAQGATLSDVIDELSPEVIAQHLYTTGMPDPDLIIRTSGEVRLSGFLLWQSANSEFYFCEAHWPAFRKIDFLRALRDFTTRERRFGR